MTRKIAKTAGTISSFLEITSGQFGQNFLVLLQTKPSGAKKKKNQKADTTNALPEAKRCSEEVQSSAGIMDKGIAY